MKNFICILILNISFFISGLYGNSGKKLTLVKTNTHILIDGVIDDEWKNVDKADNFFQMSPFYGRKPNRETYAKLITTDESIYCLIVCFDDSENIQKQTGRLDDMYGDVVSVMFDTFGDKSSAYKFAVSAAGVRSDSRLLDDGRNRDYSWDGIWFSAAKIYDWGFVVEIEIPYKSIQYDETLSEWGLDFDRWRPADSEDLYWCEYDKSEGQRISKFGKLIFKDFKPNVKGLNLEFYPVTFGKINYIENGKYKVDLNAGIDIFYNPSPQLTLQATANPDFAQIEADPYSFNISRYETFYSERRPFFTQGREIFMPSGAENNSGFYRPMELFYSRRIGKLLPDGTEVPITFGAKASGRINNWEYGGFVAKTEEIEYTDENGNQSTEPNAVFISGRVKKQILDNSSLGVLFVGKNSQENTYGVIDVDGAFRGSNWQLAYQIARSIKNQQGDFAASIGFRKFDDSWGYLFRSRYVGNKFDISQVGFVPWAGTFKTVALTGPTWFPKDGYFESIFLYGGGIMNYEKIDNFIDFGGLLGISISTKHSWGFEINIDGGKSKDLDVEYNFYDLNLSTWFHQPEWNANIYGGLYKTYNFSRDYLSKYAQIGGQINWNIFSMLKIGSSFGTYFEYTPKGKIEELTINTRPYFSFTPVNDLNISFYVDNIYLKSSDKIERILIGGLFAYQFSPKSWIYFALNEIHQRNEPIRKLSMKERVAVFKVKYLYYF